MSVLEWVKDDGRILSFRERERERFLREFEC
jgi:hypothetical protein